MRVIVRIPASACPELTADLARVPLRARAERLRTLATLGLVLLHRDLDAGLPLAPSPLDAEATSAPDEPAVPTLNDSEPDKLAADDPGRRRLLTQLGASLEPSPADAAVAPFSRPSPSSQP